MQMPQEEIGMIKEGPAIRYLTGQALWDKKFSHALRMIAKHREKNLKTSRTKDTAKIVKLWQDKVKSHDAKHHHLGEHEPNAQNGLEAGSAAGSDAEWEDDGHAQSNTEDPRTRAKGRKGKKPDLFLDQSWSWTWALKGEAPPPSSIVSRRDFVSQPLGSEVKTCEADELLSIRPKLETSP